MEDQYASKNGDKVDFHGPDIISEVNPKNMSGLGKSWEFKNSTIEDSNKKLRVKASKEFIRMNCIMTEITYNSNTMGSIIRLEPAEDLKPQLAFKQLKAQLNLQFAFDPLGMRYIQQNCEEHAQ